MKIQVYQIDTEKDTNRVKFQGLEEKGYAVDPKIYSKVFDGKIDCDNLETLYRKLNLDEKPPLFFGHSLSVSDVVCVEGQSDVDDNGCFYCDTVGWQKIMFDTDSVPKEKNTMQVVVVEPNKPAYKGEMPHTLKAMQKVVGGNIEVVYGNNDGTVIVCDEEGKLKGYEGNRKLNNGSIIAGTFFVCGDDGENFCSLSESQAEKYMKLFETPQEISDEEVQEDTKIMFFGL